MDFNLPPPEEIALFFHKCADVIQTAEEKNHTTINLSPSGLKVLLYFAIKTFEEELNRDEYAKGF